MCPILSLHLHHSQPITNGSNIGEPQDSTPGTVKPVPVSLVEPVAYQFSVSMFRHLHEEQYRRWLQQQRSRTAYSHHQRSLIAPNKAQLSYEVITTKRIPTAYQTMLY